MKKLISSKIYNQEIPYKPLIPVGHGINIGSIMQYNTLSSPPTPTQKKEKKENLFDAPRFANYFLTLQIDILFHTFEFIEKVTEQ